MMRFLCFIIVVVTISCQREDMVFNQTPTQRQQQAIFNLKKELTQAPYGWQVIYFPRTDSLLFSNANKVVDKNYFFRKKLAQESFGGYYFLMKFKEDGTLFMKADFDKKSFSTEKESEYQLSYNSSLQLSFTTHNYLHEIINDKFRASSDFLFYGKDSIENLVFKTLKYIEPAREYIVFKKLKKAQDWSAFTEQSYKNRMLFLNMKNPQLTIKKGSKVFYKSDIYIKGNAYNFNQKFLDAILNNRAYVFEFGYTPNQDPNKPNSPEKSIFLGSGFVGNQNGIVFRSGIRYSNTIVFYDFIKQDQSFISKHYDIYGFETGFVAEIKNEPIKE